MSYQWFPATQKNNFTTIHVLYNCSSIILKLKSPPNSLKIEYKDVAGSTLVEYERNEKTVEDIFFNVLIDDLKLLVKNQKSCLLSLVVKSNNYFDVDEGYNESRLDPVISRIIDCLAASLREREQKLKIYLVVLETVDIRQAATILNLLDLSALKFIEIAFGHREGSVEISGILEVIQEWTNGRKNLELHFWLYDLSAENLDVIEKILLRSTSFYRIEVYYKSCGTNLKNYFKLPFQELNQSVFKNITFMFKVEDPESTVQEPPIENKESFLVLENPLIMKNVLEYLECFEIQRLLKTSYGIRDCVDQLKPCPRISKYSISLESDRSVQTTITLNSGRYKKVRYEKYRDWDGNCGVHCGKKYMEGENLWAVVGNDFNLVMKNQNDRIEELVLDFSFPHSFRENSRRPSLEYREISELTLEFLSVLELPFTSREPLKVKKLIIGSVEQRDVIRVLPYLCNLEILDIRYPYKKVIEKLLEVDELSMLSQWKNANELIVNTIQISTPIQEMGIVHSARVDILIPSISSDEIFYLKTVSALDDGLTTTFPS
ncbi:hypothetical protein GCK72_021737 [Caenorhabditis remanei]|uniref:DUF38 domain-containing protein n=1 Tax=Caenorhabditis remanei TaxID=31234 RepID=A0A6A5GIZ1_CAERE|nr:hypothetical protein GCK72_021737 [Caenorhabditis remanei]KAF1755168.1 hypothetical protein GCK72_021737 [Caenorhabditis remanei]